MTPDVNEVLRYLGVRGEPGPELRRMAEETAAELTEKLSPRYVYRVFPLARTGAGWTLDGAGVTLAGTLAERMLEQCHHAALLACTLGWEFDRLLEETQLRDMSRAVILDACGGAMVEAGCDRAERELKERLPGQFFTDRFSPGYGDLPLTLQGAICAALDTDRRLGLHVTPSFMLRPVKSVTAVVGISDVPRPARLRGCQVCDRRETCPYQERGERCEG